MPPHCRLLPGLLFATTLASAQTSLKEVVVTSERAETVLRSTPVSAGVVDGEDLENQNLTQLSDLTGRVAGFIVPNGFSNQPQAVAIRGVGASQPAMSQAVGIYIDDVPLVRGYGTALWDLPDITRIEVLRGPQGTLHGQNSTGGAIKIVSLEPSSQAEGWVSAIAGNLGTRGLRGYLTRPVGDSPLSTSLAFSSRRNDGFGYNAATGERINRLGTTQWRAKVRWSPDSTSSVVLAIDGLHDRSDTNTQNYPLNHPLSSARTSYTVLPNGDFARDSFGTTLTAKWQLSGGIAAQSITAWREFTDDPTVVDVGGQEVQRFGLRQRVTQRAISQEGRLLGRHGAANWTVGAIVQRDDFDFRRFTTIFPLAAPSPSYSEAWSKLRTTDFGVYGQYRLPLGIKSAFTFGLRGWRTAQEGSNAFWRTNVSGERTTNVYDASGLSTHNSGVTPRFVIDSQLNPGHFVYASFTQGAKFGGFNRAAESERSARFATSPERVTTVEVGSKSRHLDNQVDISVAGFYNHYRDLLASLSNTTIEGALVPEPVLVNAGRARSWGVNLEVAAKLSPQTRLELAAEALQSRIDRFGANAMGVEGNRLPNAPSASGGLTLRRRQRLANVGLADMAVSVKHVRAYYTDLMNTRDLKTPEQTVIDANLVLREASGNWSLTLAVQNLFGRDVPLLRTRIPPLGVDSAFWNAPRTVTVSLRWDM